MVTLRLSEIYDYDQGVPRGQLQCLVCAVVVTRTEKTFRNGKKLTLRLRDADLEATVVIDYNGTDRPPTFEEVYFYDVVTVQIQSASVRDGVMTLSCGKSGSNVCERQWRHGDAALPSSTRVRVRKVVEWARENYASVYSKFESARGRTPEAAFSSLDDASKAEGDVVWVWAAMGRLEWPGFVDHSDDEELARSAVVNLNRYVDFHLTIVDDARIMRERVAVSAECAAYLLGNIPAGLVAAPKADFPEAPRDVGFLLRALIGWKDDPAKREPLLLALRGLGGSEPTLVALRIECDDAEGA